MSSRSNVVFKLLGVIFLLNFLVACQDTLPTRQTISPANKFTDDDEEDEEEEAAVRPTGAALFKTDYCACKDGKAISYGNCSSFCAGQNTNGQEKFFANFTVTADISLNPVLGNINGWCTALLPGDETNPKCIIEAKDDQGGVINLDATSITGTNSITADISALPTDKTFVLTLIETISGAKSDSVQIIKFSTDTPLPILGPLKHAPISQYSCLIREFSTDDSTGEVFFDLAYRIHFYFLPRVPPSPIPAGNSNLICHDIFDKGPVDDVLFDRFELILGAFNLWDTSDPRFFDNNGNGNQDANDIIIQKAKNFGASNIPAATKFFTPFEWPGGPELADDAGNSNNALPLGFFMAPWIDQTTFKSYCLTSEQYNSTNPLFKAMRDIVQTDTEGLYIGEKAPETVFLSDGTTVAGEKDLILMKESDLKRIWFFMNNGVPTAPTDNNVQNVQVFFYYPPNFASPFVKSSTQRTFRVKSALELQSASVPNSSANSSGGTSSFPPHDRKIGCVPKF